MQAAIQWTLAIEWCRWLVSEIASPIISEARIAVRVVARSIGTNRSTNRRFAIHADTTESSRAIRAEAAQRHFGDSETFGTTNVINRQTVILVRRAVATLDFQVQALVQIVPPGAAKTISYTRIRYHPSRYHPSRCKLLRCSRIHRAAALHLKAIQVAHSRRPPIVVYESLHRC
jgi:hypothetical protein